MPIKTYVTTFDPEEERTIEIEGVKILPTLGPKEESFGIQLQELLESVTAAIRPSIVTESQLVIEVSGQVDLKAKGGTKYLFFNVGGEAGKTRSMKVVLTTNLNPTSYE